MKGKMTLVTRSRVGSFASLTILMATAGGLTGCVTDCVEWRDQTVNVQVCDRYSNTGWCAASHYETRSQPVCVKRASK